MSDFIGSRTRSKEGPRHVTGRGLYTDDFILPGMLQAMILRSPHAHAKILSVDPSPALANANVVAVITPDDIKQRTKPFKPGRYAAGLKRPIDEYAGAVDKVRYVGEPLGVVPARDRGTAEDALELISVEYEPIRPVVDVREAIKPSSATLFEELGSNLAWHGSLQYGDIDGAFKSAERVVKENLKIHRYSSTPLEPFVVIASYDAGSKRLTVWVTAQVPEVIYDGLREALGLQDIRGIIPDVGGGFGQKIHLIRKYVVLVSLLAMKTGRPVKWIEDRTEHMMAGGHACAQEVEAEAAVKNEGTAVVTNKCPVIPNRGIGKPGMCFIWERMMDRVAQALNLSPIEVRRKNLIQANEMPYRTVSGNLYDSGDYPGLLQALLEKLDYEKLREEQKREREKGRLIGIGVVIGVEPGGRNAARDMAIFPEMKEPPGSGGINGATIKLEKNGTLALFLGSPNCGQAHETTTAQVAADVLGTTPDQVSTTIPFDSDLSPWGVAAANSGNNFHLYDIGAVHGAATKLREKALKLAAHVLNTQPAELTIENGVVHVPGSATKRVTFAELGRIAYNNQHLIPDGMEAGLQATYYYTFPHAKPNIVPGPDRLVRAQFTFSAGAHAAVVEVDKATGKVHVLRYLIVGDNGTVINPDVVNGQVYGSAAHGIAVALGEGFMYSAEGQPLTITYLDYGKCSTAETPRVEVVHQPSPSPFTVLGQKAAGEGAAIPSPAAIASAVEDALQPFGVRVCDLPLTPEVVWRLANGNPDSVRRSY